MKTPIEQNVDVEKLAKNILDKNLTGVANFTGGTIKTLIRCHRNTKN